MNFDRNLRREILHHPQLKHTGEGRLHTYVWKSCSLSFLFLNAFSHVSDSTCLDELEALLG